MRTTKPLVLFRSMPPKRKSTGESPSKKKVHSIPSSGIDPELATKCINSVRVLAADTVEKAKSGHPGAPMGCAPIAHVLWSEFMNYSPANPSWSNRDRFVLSNGHACALLYRLKYLFPLSNISFIINTAVCFI